MFQQVPFDQFERTLVVIGTAHRESDAPELTLLEPSSRRGGEEPPHELLMIYNVVISLKHFRQMHQYRWGQDINVTHVITNPHGHRSGIAPGMMNLGEQIDGPKVERIPA